MHRVISSFLIAFMAHQTKVKFGLKPRKSSQNAMLTVTASTWDIHSSNAKWSV
jgi:hypothetical protein